MSFSGLDDKKLLRAFLVESEELLEKLNDNLLSLEKDASNPDSINEVFRLTHSLKSESALLGFVRLSELAHRLEDVFDSIRAQNLALSRPLMDAIFSASDLIHEIISRISIGHDDTEVDTRLVIEELKQLAGLALASEKPVETVSEVAISAEAGELPLGSFQRAQVLEARDRGETIYKLTIPVSAEAELKFPRAYLVFNNLEMIANVIQTSPDMAVSQDDRLYERLVVLLSSHLPPEQLLKACAVDLIDEPELEVLKQGRIDELLSRRIEGEQVISATPRSARIESSSVRVDTDKLNEIWQLVGELTIYKAQLAQLHDRLARRRGNESVKSEVERASDSLERITAEMQQAIMGTRMVPIAVLFNKFPRLVRDLSRKLGKNVELEIQGKETEIDRTIVEVLSDPLTHIIRNSLDHGLEQPEERRKANKPDVGRIAITAQQQGGKIVIEIADDGRGLNVEKIRKKAGIGSEISDEEAIQYIFSPGFSTKEDVTDLSGRGVGMDVVATRIREDLKGEVEVRSDPGGGTLIRILLPLTLTILHSLVISCAGYYYAVPVQDIKETVKISEQEIRINGESELYSFNSEEVPLLRLDSILLGPANENKYTAQENNGVVVQQRRGKVCLLVDELVEEEDLVIKPISDLLNHRRLFSGVSVLGDGRIIFILDTARIIDIVEFERI
ncbi:MAG: chemotaxis protein CheA [Spirochaetaceae bacterium]|nr:MAG: chemotaxis protein CheA [Spirochaetaceae bacterium]